MTKPEKDRLLGHADEADGIEEYDNPLPDWWLGLFWVTIVWSVVYIGWYHVVARKSLAGTLAAEIAEAEQRWPTPVRDAAQLDLSAAAVDEGKAIYAQNCVGCHGAGLLGGIGPNLKDTVWIHGNTRADIYRTITEGVAAKGMPAWAQMIGPDKVAKVTAYVIHENGGVTR